METIVFIFRYETDVWKTQRAVIEASARPLKARFMCVRADGKTNDCPQWPSSYMWVFLCVHVSVFGGCACTFLGPLCGTARTWIICAQLQWRTRVLCALWTSRSDANTVSLFGRIWFVVLTFLCIYLFCIISFCINVYAKKSKSIT